MSGRVLIVMDASSAWSRGALMGFAGVANQHDWTVLHYHPMSDLEWLLKQWDPQVVVLPAGSYPTLPRSVQGRALVAVNADRSSEGIASVCLDEAKVGAAAASHLLATGQTHLTTFRFDTSPFAIARERAFEAAVVAAGRELVPRWWLDTRDRIGENPAEITRWLQELPKPCGIFACTDSWARVIARYCRVAGINIPEQVAVMGVDNDVIDCEFASPPLSSVAIPWRLLGQHAAELVGRALAGNALSNQRIVVEPLDVVVRRSTEVLAVTEPLVKRAIQWIEAHAHVRISIPAVAKATGTTRQTLERRFRAVLGRTVLQEIRRAHVDLAKRLLSTTNCELIKVAQASGFTNAALLNVAFVKETGVPPGAYRKQFLSLYRDED